MTTAEALVILFVNDMFFDFCKSLRSEQVVAFDKALDMSQKILLLELMDTACPPDDPDAIRSARQEAWTKLVRAARAQVEGVAEAAQ